MSEAGNTCVALMVSAAWAPTVKSIAVAMNGMTRISRPPVVRAVVVLPRRSYHRRVTTVFSAFEQTARGHPARPFLIVYPERIEYTYREALEQIQKLSSIYRSRGYGPGH